MPPSLISPITVQRRPAYDDDSFHYVTKGADSEQPVGAPCYQWVGCRDHAGIACFPHSGSWQAQGGPAYIWRDQRKWVFHNMGPLREGGVLGKGEPVSEMALLPVSSAGALGSVPVSNWQN